MQAGEKVSPPSAYPFVHADISIRRRSDLCRGERRLCPCSSPRKPPPPPPGCHGNLRAVRAPVFKAKKPAGFHHRPRCGNALWLLSINASVHPACLKNTARAGILQRNTTICLLCLGAATLSLLGEQTLRAGEGR